jgi:hypothetical protein
MPDPGAPLLMLGARCGAFGCHKTRMDRRTEMLKDLMYIVSVVIHIIGAVFGALGLITPIKNHDLVLGGIFLMLLAQGLHRHVDDTRP